MWDNIGKRFDDTKGFVVAKMSQDYDDWPDHERLPEEEEEAVWLFDKNNLVKLALSFWHSGRANVWLSVGRGF